MLLYAILLVASLIALTAIAGIALFCWVSTSDKLRLEQKKSARLEENLAFHREALAKETGHVRTYSRLYSRLEEENRRLRQCNGCLSTKLEAARSQRAVVRVMPSRN